MELKIDGSLIGYMTLTNRGYADAEISSQNLFEDEDLGADPRKSRYEVEYFVPTQGLKKADVFHRPTDGTLILIKKSLDVLSRTKLENNG